MKIPLNVLIQAVAAMKHAIDVMPYDKACGDLIKAYSQLEWRVESITREQGVDVNTEEQNELQTMR